MLGKKPPRIAPSQIERALGSTRPLPGEDEAGLDGPGKRRSRRQKTWAPCHLTWPVNGKADGVCIDVSETGARIRFSHKIIVPDRLRLVSARLNLNRDCEIIRQDGYDALVRFLI